MQLLRKIKFNKTKLDTYYTLNPDQLAVSIGSSRKRLLQRDVITGTKALAKGLQQQRFIPGMSLLLFRRYYSCEIVSLESVGKTYDKNCSFDDKCKDHIFKS